MPYNGPVAFTYADYHALVEALLAHPEWRAELRPLILGEELLGLPDWAHRTDERLDRLTDAIGELVAAGRRTDERLDRLTESVAGLIEAQRRTDERLDRLTEKVEGLTETVAALVDAQKNTDQQLLDLLGATNALSGRISQLEGSNLEHKYHRQLATYVGDIIRKPRTIAPYDLDALMAAVEAGTVHPNAFRRLRELDLLAQGQELGTGRELLLTCEVSWTVNLDDVERAEDAAMTLRRVGYHARAFVAGYRIHTNARQHAEAAGVAIYLHRPPSPGSGSQD